MRRVLVGMFREKDAWGMMVLVLVGRKIWDFEV